MIDGLTRFIESANIDNKLIRRADDTELKESMSRMPARLHESFESEAAAGWWVPVSFYNKRNGNNRIYNRQLWENVINNQRDTWVGAPMLADHPEGDSDGSPKDICGIWLDAKMDPPDHNGIGLVYGLLIPSGHIGQDLKDHLKNGLKVGTSSSGFGKLMSDGCTVDPNSFVIERLSDWVLNPSQGSFFCYDKDSEDVQDRSKYGEKMANNLEVTQININEAVEPAKEKTMKESKITGLELKKFRRDMESFLESACNIRDPQAKLEEFKEIKSYLEDGACPDLKEKVEQKIKEQEEFIKTALMEKLELQEELHIESPKDLKRKLTKIAEDAAVLDQDAKEWKKIAETLQAKLDETTKELESRHTNTYVEHQEKRVKALEESLAAHEEKAKGLINDIYKNYQNITAAYTESVKAARKERDVLAEKLEMETSLRESLEASTLDMAAKITESNIKLTESAKVSEELSVVSEKVSKLNNEITFLTVEKESMEEENNSLKEKVEQLTESVKQLSEIADNQRTQIEKLYLSKRR